MLVAAAAMMPILAGFLLGWVLADYFQPPSKKYDVKTAWWTKESENE